MSLLLPWPHRRQRYVATSSTAARTNADAFCAARRATEHSIHHQTNASRIEASGASSPYHLVHNSARNHATRTVTRPIQSTAAGDDATLGVGRVQYAREKV
jgi:hypothetical protein